MLCSERIVDGNRRRHRGVERIVLRIVRTDQSVDGRAALRVQHHTGDTASRILVR